MVRKVLVRAIVLVVLVSMLVPFVANAAYRRPLYVHGHVWDETNSRGVKGAVVELYRDTGSGMVLVASRTTETTNGDFIIGAWAVPGRYQIKIVSVPAGIHPLSVWMGYKVPLRDMDPEDEETWYYTWYYAGGGPEEPCYVGPVDFYCANDDTPPNPSSWVYIYGRVYDPDYLVNEATDTTGGVADLPVQLEREIVKDERNTITSSWEVLRQTQTDDGGFFGWGVNAIEGMYRVSLAGANPADYVMTEMYIRVNAPAWVPWQPMGGYNLGPLMFPTS